MQYMKAAVLHAVGQLTVDSVPVPERKSGEVLLRVGACGVCGSDLPRVFEKGTYHFPTIPGHEFAGTIVDADDSSLIGRKAAVFPLLPCRKCPSCEVGEYVNCSDYDYYGSRRDGAFAEYISVDVRNLVLCPDDLPLEVAAMCEPGSVARAAVRKLGVRIGDTAVVFGAGPIGIIAAQWMRVAGAKMVRIVDISEEKTAFAGKFGFLPYDRERDGLANCVLEGTGASSALNNAVLSLKNHGRLVLMGNPMRDMNIENSVYSQILRREITMMGTWNSSFNAVTDDWSATIDAMSQGLIDYASLITHRYPIERCPEALEMMKSKTEFYTKVMIINE